MLTSFKPSSPTAKPERGFTIVELLIVIVVIGILAAITIVAYNGIQQRANDARRKSDLDQIAQLLTLYDQDKNGPMWTGSGCENGNGNGWFNLENGSTYVTSGMHCLQNDNLTSATIIDPSGRASCATNTFTCHAYMKYTCTLNGDTVTYVYANLETVGHTDADTDGTCSPAADTNYGMNYYVEVTDD